ncbi:transferrin receptor protein 1-like isoform 1-T3 [Synchiropus picturatus]
MDQARSTISKIFNGEPHSYTRFNLTQNMEGDNSHVEMKLPTDMDEEAGGNSAMENLNHNSNRKSYVVYKNGRTPKNIIFFAAIAVLIFLIGYLISYGIHGKKKPAPSFPPPVYIEGPDVPHAVVAPFMNWNNVKALLSQSLRTADLERTFSEYLSSDHRAGSEGDYTLGNKVMERFQAYGMAPWTDEHFIKVQDPPISGSNKIIFKGREQPLTGFLSYSATGSVTGGVLYAHYGRDDDFRLLRDKNINMTGRVVLARAGKISFAEKVANAAKVNAVAVLIYKDQSEYPIGDAEVYGHVHLGSGDPYTPGFPSFNHTQFPPIQSSGLPKILAQTISHKTAMNILNQLGGENWPRDWGYNRLGLQDDTMTVQVNNVLTEKKIHNVFGVIKGYVDPDRYVIIGARRDAWEAGFAASTVGTSVLVELARCITETVKNGFKPRRSIVFASWSAGEYGSVGATEWLEGYLTSLNMKAFSYINLDGIVTGNAMFKVSASPLMYSLIEKTLKEVKVEGVDSSMISAYGKGNWEANVLEPLTMDDAAYPFIAFSGIPSLSFRFTKNNIDYPFFGTRLDTQERLNMELSNQTPLLAQSAARFAGHIALRMVHDHLLPLDLQKYDVVIRNQVSEIYKKVKAIQRLPRKILPKALTVQWLSTASSAYNQAARKLENDVENSNLEDIEMCRNINDQIMMVERNFLSSFVSARDTPFRHILLGSGPHTLKGLSNHLDALSLDNPEADADLFQTQFALATWTIQGCANALAGSIWSLNEV